MDRLRFTIKPEAGFLETSECYSHPTDANIIPLIDLTVKVIWMYLTLQWVLLILDIS